MTQDETVVDGRTETRVWLTLSDILYTRADLFVHQEGHLGAVVDGMLLDLGPVNDRLRDAMELATIVNIRADHYLGGLIERQVPLVHQ
jgi:hypothetical protein